MFEKKLDYYDFNSFLKLKDDINIDFLDRFYNYEISFLENDNFYNNYFIGLFYFKYAKNIDIKTSKIYLKYFYKKKNCGNELLDEIYLSRISNDDIKKGIYLKYSNNNLKYFDLFRLYENKNPEKAKKYLNKGVKLDDVMCLYQKTFVKNENISQYLIYIKILNRLKEFEDTKLYIDTFVRYYSFRIEYKFFNNINYSKKLEDIAEKYKHGDAYVSLFLNEYKKNDKISNLYIDLNGFIKYKTSGSVFVCNIPNNCIFYLLKSQECENTNLNIFKLVLERCNPDLKSIHMRFCIYLNIIKFDHESVCEDRLLSILKCMDFIIFSKERILQILFDNLKYIDYEEFIKLDIFKKKDIIHNIVPKNIGQKRMREN